ARIRRSLHRGPRDTRHHHGMTGADQPPGIDERPDTSPRALQALRDDFLYFNVAGSGPTFPVAQRAAERFRGWLNEVGMFGHVGYAAYNAALDGARADMATALGVPDQASNVALAQSATDGLNTLVAGLAIAPGSLMLTTAEEHGSALYPLRLRAEHGDQLREITWHRDGDRFLDEVRRGMRYGARALLPSLASCKTGTVDAAAFVGLRQTLAVHRALGGWVPTRVRALRRRLLERLRELPFALRSTPAAPTGIVVVEPPGEVGDLVDRMWKEERIVVKLIDEPGIAQA